MTGSEFVQNAISTSHNSLPPALQAGGNAISGLGQHRVEVEIHEDFRGLARAIPEVPRG